MEVIKLLLADDHPTFREGLSRLFQDEEDLDCIALAEDGDQAVKLTKEFCPDVSILDVNMPKLSGIDAARQIKKHCSETSVIMLSAYKYNHYVIASIQAGVDGYLLKNSPRNELIEAIRMVHAGKAIFNINAISKIMHRFDPDGRNRHDVYSLRRREVDVLKLTARGMSNKDIARKLSITTNTVGTHLVSVFRKLGVESRTEAALCALREGLITVDDIAEKPET